MKSVIISGLCALARKTADKFKKSRVCAVIDSAQTVVSKSWNSSVIINFLKGNAVTSAKSVVRAITMSPFTLIEKVQKKYAPVLSEKVEKSVICELARRYVHSFMALNTRFFGVMGICASLAYNIIRMLGGGLSKGALVMSVICAVFICFNVNITGLFETSALMNFAKACAGVKKVTFKFYDEDRTRGALSVIAAAGVGAALGVMLGISPILALLVPFALFGMLLVLMYPVTGVYAAVFLAPLISFSSMPLAGICIFTLIALVIKSVICEDFVWRREGVGVTLVLFLAVLLISSVFSFAGVASLKVWAMYFVFVSFYFAVINTIDTRAKLYGLLRVFVISGAIVAIYGVMQYLFGWTTTNAWIDEEMFEEETMRVYSTLANPNVLGEYLLLVLPVSVVFFIKDKAKSLSKWVYLAIAAVMFLCLILTQSRGCWLGIMLTIAIFVTFYDGRLWALVPLALCAAVFILPQTIIERLMSIGDMGDSSTSYRVYIWMGVMGMLRHYWAGGIGMGEAAFREVYPLFSYNAIVAPHAHNTYLQLLVEGGIYTLMTFIALIVVFFKSGYKSYKQYNKKSKSSLMILGLCSGAAGFLLQSMFDYTFYNYRVMAVFFIIIAATVCFRYTSAEELAKEERNAK